MNEQERQAELDLLPVGVLHMDGTGTVLRANRMVDEMLGLVPSEVINPKVESWRGSEPAATTCGEEAPAPVDEDFDLDVTIAADDSAADDIGLSLYVHGDSINQGL